MANVKVYFDSLKVKTRLNVANNIAQKWLDNEVLKDCSPYVPRLSGALERSGISGTKIGSGLIVYQSPYGRYQYYGKVMVGKAPKQVTDKDLIYSKQAHPKATRTFFETAKAINKPKWVAGAKRLGGGG